MASSTSRWRCARSDRGAQPGAASGRARRAMGGGADTAGPRVVRLGGGGPWHLRLRGGAARDQIVAHNLAPRLVVPGERWAVVLTLLVPASFAWAVAVHGIFDFAVALRAS